MQDPEFVAAYRAVETDPAVASVWCCIMCGAVLTKDLTAAFMQTLDRVAVFKDGRIYVHCPSCSRWNEWNPPEQGK